MWNTAPSRRVGSSGAHPPTVGCSWAVNTLRTSHLPGAICGPVTRGHLQEERQEALGVFGDARARGRRRLLCHLIGYVKATPRDGGKHSARHVASTGELTAVINIYPHLPPSPAEKAPRSHGPQGRLPPAWLQGWGAGRSKSAAVPWASCPRLVYVWPRHAFRVHET